MNLEETYRTFRAQGYVVLPSALSADELEVLTRTVDTLLAEPVDDGGGHLHDIGRGQDRRFLRLRHDEFPELRDFVLGDRVRTITETLLAAPPHLFVEQFVVKGPHTGAAFAWHQDSGYVGFEHQPYVTLWIAIDDATIENGCVWILPRNLDEDDDVDTHSWDADNKERVGYHGDDPGIAVVVPAGTIVAFSSRTQHRSGPNTTDAPRRAYICQYSPEPIIDPETNEARHFAIPLAG